MTLDEAGRQLNGYLNWRISSDRPLLWISVSGSVADATPLTAGEAYGSINWARPFPGTRRPPKQRMELSSTPDNRFWFFSVPFASDYARGQQTIAAHWPDLVAFARGTETLWLLVRNERREIGDRVALDRALILNGEREIANALEQLRTMATDFRERCERREDDGSEQNIIVT